MIKIMEVPTRSPLLLAQLLNVWETSVRATHTFLSDAEIIAIKKYVPEALTQIEHLLVATDENDAPIAFMGIADHKLEMLFVAPQERGRGYGKQLIQEGVQKYGVRTLTVNEQNPAARGFYEHMGFYPYHRTDTDEQGNPYPILYMKLKDESPLLTH